MRPIEHIITAVGELNQDLPSPRSTKERQEASSAHALVAIAQLLETQNNLLSRIADGIFLAAGER